MNATLKIIGSTSIWEQYRNQEWNVKISLYTAKVHSFTHDEKEYLFEIKETIIDEKIILTGWLVGDNKSGNIVFELQ